MRVATKLSLAFTTLILILAGLLVYHVRTNRTAVAANFELAEISSRLHLTANRQIAAINQLEEAAGKFWITRDEGYLQLFEDAFREFAASLEELEGSDQTDLEREAVEALQKGWREFQPIAADVDAGILLSDAPAAALGYRIATLRQQAQEVAHASRSAMHDRLETSAAAARRAERISWIAGTATLLLSVLVFTVIVRSISRGLNRLQTGTRQVALGNFAYRLPVEEGDEFGMLARDFNVMTRRLGELDRTQRSFLSKVSHDLKTPLASMRETVQLMLDGMPGPVTERQHRLLDLTMQSAHRLSSMIEKILDLSAIEGGGLVLERRPCNIDSIIGPAIEALQLGDPDRRSPIEIDIAGEPLSLECDPDRTVQVIVNLLENAEKFSPPGAPIRIRARPIDLQDRDVPPPYRRHLQQPGAAGLVLIEVSDRGPGIPDAEKRRVFEDFYQAGVGSGLTRRGVGLGLAICREIVERHGGAIWVRDNVEGGSTFALLMPRELSEAIWDAPAPAEGIATGLAQR
jgi:signal transduction histidine kinase